MARPLLLAILVVLLAAAPAPAMEALEPGSAPAPLPPTEVFPVDGATDFGYPQARFGGGRGHQGQDVFADCGTPVLAAEAARVVDAKYDGAAGHYAVLSTRGGRSHVYMHLRAPARVAVGDRVAAGDRLGAVGDTGRAWDCHLHFEVWTAPGWYRGGRPLDPLPYLRSLRG